MQSCLFVHQRNQSLIKELEPKLKVCCESFDRIDQLHNALLQNKVCCVDIVKTYLYHLLALNKELSFITEYLFLEALQVAEALDDHLEKTGQLVGPLHGIPIALNDDLDVKGYDSCLGCKCGCLMPKYLDAPLVSVLKASGAIILCKTNVPWHCLAGECSNAVYGRTKNPLNHHLSPGISSGGLASLLAVGGCLVGIGSDCVGGLRIPAQNCGLYTLRPTSGRFPGKTLNNFTFSWETVPTLLGPMTRNLDDLVYCFRALLDLNLEDRIDPTSVPMSFNHRLYQQSKRLKIGYFVHDGFFRASPAAARAVNQVVKLLQQAGHETIRISIPSADTAMILLSKLLAIDYQQTDECGMGLMSYFDADTGEPLLPLVFLLKAPRFMRNIFGFFFDKIMDDRITAELIRRVGLGPFCSSDTLSLWKLLIFWWWYLIKWILEFVLGSSGEVRPSYFMGLKAEKEDYQRRFNELWTEYPDLDAMICPVHAIPPMPGSSFPYICAGASYSMLFSLLDYPCGVIPNVTQVRGEDRVVDVLDYVHEREDEPLGPTQDMYFTNYGDPHFQYGNGFGQVPFPPAPPPLPHIELPGDMFPDPHRSISFNFLGILGMEEFNAKLSEGILNQGCQVGIQVVGERFKEEKVLNVMQVVNNLLNK